MAADGPVGGGGGLQMYKRHELKLLNLALILYLALGAFVFDLLGDFEGPKSVSDDKSGKKMSLAELRLGSVGRMWNITNQLNILYEFNWTSLVAEELAIFERQLVEMLARRLEEADQIEVPEEDQEREAEVSEGGKADREDKEDKEKKRSETVNNNRRIRRRIRSIKRSVIHSLATITTIGSPLGQPRSQIGKLATILYGTLGIPLLVFTVSQTGRRLAHSSLNLLIIVRHYCFRLPYHYLCCSCSPDLCSRFLGLCCCCYCCCLLAKNKTKFCDRNRAPKLRLSRHRPAKAAKVTYCGPQSTAYVINPQDQMTTPVHGLHKSVRFMSQNETKEPVQQIAEQLQQSPYTWSLFLTSLAILLLYFSLAAYIYSGKQNITLIDAIFICYSMLSTSKLPEFSSQLNSWAKNPLQVYEFFKSGSHPNENETSVEMIISESLFLLCGLLIISMSAHLASLWLSAGPTTGHPESSYNRASIDKLSSGCNGHIARASIGDIRTSAPFLDLQQTPVLDTIEPINSSQIHMMPLEHQARNNINPIQRQHQQEVNLAELFVVSQHDSPPEMQFGRQSRAQVAQQQQQQTSDVSFASDRSTGSLCIHHQVQLPGSPVRNIYEPNPIYSHQHHHHIINQPVSQHNLQSVPYHNHPKHLFVRNQQTCVEDNDDEGEDDEMKKILNCLGADNRTLT